ncbi:MAG: LSU ribosomal protein L10p (P0), partial [uncultured Microvirga sp.]
GKSRKSSARDDPQRRVHQHERRRRRPLQGPHGRRHAEAARADEAGRRRREGRQEQPHPDRSRRHGRRVHPGPHDGSDPDRVFERSGRGGQGRCRFRQGQRETRDPRRSDGQDRSECRRREGARHSAVARRTARQDRGARQRARHEAGPARQRAGGETRPRVRSLCHERRSGV